MPKGEHTQEWCVQVLWKDDEAVSKSVRNLRRVTVERTIRDAFTDNWTPKVKVVTELESEDYKTEDTVEEMETQALSVLYDVLSDDDDLADLFGNITTRTMKGYDAREDPEEEDSRYNEWWSTLTNVRNRVMAKYMHQQFYPRDFT